MQTETTFKVLFGVWVVLFGGAIGYAQGKAMREHGSRFAQAADIDIGEARRRRERGETMRQVADHFNVSVRTIQRCLNRGDRNPRCPAR